MLHQHTQRYSRNTNIPNFKSALLIIVSILALNSCRVGNFQGENIGGDISGVVRDMDTGATIVNAEITIIDTGYTRHSNVEGKFLIENASTNSEFLRIRAELYQTHISIIQFDIKKIIEVDIQMEKLSTTPLSINGLDLYLPFSGNPNDESINGHQVEISNLYLARDKFKTFRNAYQYNGSNSYIQTNLDRNLYSELSICTWFSFDDDSLNTTYPLLASSNSSFWIGKDKNDTSIGIYDGDYTSIEFNKINPWNNQWHHLCYVNGGNETLLYLDKSSKNIIISGGGTGNIFIGNDDVQGSNSFYGIIDEVMIYNRKISSEEVETIYGHYKDIKDTKQLIVGHWRGSIASNEYITKDIELYLGENWFPIKYSSPDCKGELLLISQNQSSMTFKEDFDNQNCTENGFVKLEKISETQLAYSWQDSNKENTVTTLTSFIPNPEP